MEISEDTIDHQERLLNQRNGHSAQYSLHTCAEGTLSDIFFTAAVRNIPAIARPTIVTWLWRWKLHCLPMRII
jgi:hypothetical protein